MRWPHIDPGEQNHFKKIAGSKVLDEYYNLQHLHLPKKVSPIPTLKYTTDPLKTLTISLFWQNTCQNDLNPLTQHQGESFGPDPIAWRIRLGCSDSISSPRTGVEAILTELGPEPKLALCGIAKIRLYLYSTAVLRYGWYLEVNIGLPPGLDWLALLFI